MARNACRIRLRSTGISQIGEPHMKRIATALIGALTIVAISPGAPARPPSDDLPREVVKFADLDLTRPAAAQELYRRIRNAARKVCAEYSPSAYERSCAQQAVARAVAEVDSPQLTARLGPLPQRLQQ